MWSTPEAFPVLPEREIHVWRCDLEALDPAHFAYSLCDEERARGARFRFERHRRRFLAARGVLRALLARYLDTSPQVLAFEYSSSGKPSLMAHNLNTHALQFNVSHSQNWALLAFARGAAIGVDIEGAREDFSDDQISRLAERFFAAGEQRDLRTLTGDAKRAAFLRCWTRKESLLKATGEGIAGGLAKYQVSLLPNEAARVLAPREEAAHWSLFDLPPVPHFAGALAVRGRNHVVQAWEFSLF